MTTEPASRLLAYSLITKTETRISSAVHPKTSMTLRFLFLFLIAAFFVAGAPRARAQNEVKLELVADVSAIEPGGTFHLAVRYEIAPGGWHIYWVNPGGTGLGSNVSFEAPDGFTVGPTQYPLPHKTVAGTPEVPNVSHTYEGTAFHSVAITAPAELEVGTTISFNANSFWQACNEFCLMPTDTELSLSLPVADAAAPSPIAAEITKALSQSQGAVPKLIANPTIEDGKLELMVVIEGAAVTSTEGAHFFSAESKLIDDNAPQEIELEDGLLTIRAALASAETVLPEVVQGFYSAGGQTVWLTSDPDAVADATPVTSADPLVAGGKRFPDKDSAEAEEIRKAIKTIASWRTPSKRSLWPMLLGAFVGGMILNLMPCVFPVLGIKIMGFVQQAGSEPATVKKHGLVFAAGVILSLWALVAVLWIVRALGQNAGWGFQLQNPWFLVFLISILFVFGLNLCGLFEFGTSLIGTGSGLQQKHGYSGSFFSGILTVLVATPCTGPFMGPALSFALTEPYHIGFLIFTALAIGLALPYALLSFFPGLIEKLPRPGAWMETFKQFMAFPLFATVVWLLRTLGNTQGLPAVIWTLAGLTALALGFWFYGKYTTIQRKPRTRWLGRLATVGLAVLALLFARHGMSMKPEVAHNVSESRFGLEWEHFDPRKIVQHRKKGRTVFIDFTADW